jgi:hypothetical protein
MSVILGFALTWGIGTILTDNYKNAQLANQRSIQAAERRRDLNIHGVNELSRLMYERRIRAELLFYSLLRHAPLAELKERKAAYDTVFVRWNRDLQATQLTIRSMVGDTEYSELESYVQYGLTPHFANIDKALTTAYDFKVRNPHGVPTIDKHYIEDELTATLDCAYSITNDLWTISNVETLEKNAASKLRAVATNELALRCPKTQALSRK